MKSKRTGGNGDSKGGDRSETSRRDRAKGVRDEATAVAFERPHPSHEPNGDEAADVGLAFTFTKGLRHDPETGLVANRGDFDRFVTGTETGRPEDFRATPAGHEEGEPWRVFDIDVEWRAWESQGAGLTFDLEGPDAQAVTMPPAPRGISTELTGEIGEVYAQALLRDEPLSEFGVGGKSALVDEVLNDLGELRWFDAQIRASEAATSDASAARRRVSPTRQTAFRGLTSAESTGPYLSQFLLMGTADLAMDAGPADGLVRYGAQTIDQRVSVAESTNFMQRWDEWLDVQDGADVRGAESYASGRRFITTGRDLATYVHFDALYQAYLNACIILLNRGIDFDPGIPFNENDQVDHQQGFATFGGPHILSLVTEVATRALKAVRFQKFNVHRRARPEALAARFEKADHLNIDGLVAQRDHLNASGIGRRISDLNVEEAGTASLLLPMAFPEGSPMHPAYGAGHATVAGACVTMLKAFFDHEQLFDAGEGAGYAWIPNEAGDELVSIPVVDRHGQRAQLTVEGELNKLAANISIGRNWAGVHYFSDYWESVLMGEEIAIGILEEQALGFSESFAMTIPRFDGDITRISNIPTRPPQERGGRKAA